jgi:hypothetical protein
MGTWGERRNPCSCVKGAKPLFFQNFRLKNIYKWPVPVAVRSKAKVCGRSLAGIVGSNPASDTGAFLL